MSEKTAQPACEDRPVYVRGPKGHFTKGAPGRPKGVKNRQTRVDMALLKAIAEKHFPQTLERLLRSKSERIKFEAIRWVGEMILGRPRQSLEVAGGLGDLGTELARALVDVRARRALEAGNLQLPEVSNPAPIVAELVPAEAHQEPVEAAIVADMPGPGPVLDMATGAAAAAPLAIVAEPAKVDG